MCIRDSFDIIQVGYTLKNTLTFFVDFHIKNGDIDIVEINNIQYPSLSWVLVELNSTMATESELKNFKRFTRSKYLKHALQNLNHFNPLFLKYLCIQSEKNIKKILGKDIDYTSLKKLCS